MFLNLAKRPFRTGEAMDSSDGIAASSNAQAFCLHPWRQVVRIAMMGAGGIGGYVGARLCEAGEDVTFVARGGASRCASFQRPRRKKPLWGCAAGQRRSHR